MAGQILAVLALVQLLCVASVARAEGEAPPAGAPAMKWDQATATDAADKLEKSIVGLRDIIRGSPQWDNPATRKYMYQIQDGLRQMEFSSQSLHASLVNGAGMEETLPTYNRVQQLRRDLEVLSKKVDITAITRPKLDEAQTWLMKLAPYYPGQPQIQDLR